MYQSNKAFAIPAAVYAAVILLGGAAWFAGKIHIPFLTTKADVQKKLDIEKADHKLTQAELDSAKKLADKQAQLLLDQGVASGKQKELLQSAANSNAKITAVNEISPPITRKDAVIDYAAKETAAALPIPTDYAAILRVVKDQLDELKTSNAALAIQHTNDLSAIDAKQKALDKALQDVKAQQDEVARQQKLNDDQKTANDAQRKVLDAKEGVINSLLEQLNKFKYAIMGLVGLAGMLCVGAGALLNNKVLLAKGVVLAILAVLGMIIPLMWYLVAVGVALLVVVAYVAKEWHKEKTFADNTAGILQETRQKAPELWANTIKPIAASYWGTGIKDVTKADAWVEQKLYNLNLLPKDKKP